MHPTSIEQNDNLEYKKTYSTIPRCLTAEGRERFHFGQSLWEDEVDTSSKGMHVL